MQTPSGTLMDRLTRAVTDAAMGHMSQMELEITMMNGTRKKVRVIVVPEEMEETFKPEDN